MSVKWLIYTVKRKLAGQFKVEPISAKSKVERQDMKIHEGRN